MYNYDEIKALHDSGLTPKEIAEKLILKPNRLRAYMSDKKLTGNNISKTKNASEQAKIERSIIEFYLVASKEIKPTKFDGKSVLNQRKIIALGDLHGYPYAPLIAAVIDSNPDVIVLGGDLFDLSGYSTHSESYPLVNPDTIQTESIRLRIMLDLILEKTTARIAIIRGNHDDRVYKRILELMGKYTRGLEFYYIDPIDVLVAGLPKDRVAVAKEKFYLHTPNGDTIALNESRYMLKLGNALFSHLNYTSNKPGGAVEKLANKWLINYRKPLGLEDINILVQFHGHKFSMVREQGGFCWLIEPGYAANPVTESYKLGYDPKWAPGTTGAISFEQCFNDHNWVNDLSSVIPVYPKAI